eukprot:2997891-Lingulodinium_polyedra.AAC.1
MAGFYLVMAMAVLRYSDMDRAKGLAINKDALYAYTWKSKSKAEGMPWAMPRRAWDGTDVGGEFYRLAEEIPPASVGGAPRAWMWPHTVIDGPSVRIHRPARHGSYGNCLAVQHRVLAMAGVTGDYTLHSARFYVPGLAGQLG